MKLTKAQMRALALLPVTIPTWGGTVFGRMPEGINSRTTLFALRKSGLASVHYEGLREKWSISPAGRLALEKSK